ncbi:MAG: carbon-nitrogen hydrolase family protein [Bacilli bacterium]|nr:carbon-nitrogen hydrolase family protein [Bacilli bacterium]
MKIAAIQLENCLGDVVRGFYEAEALIRKAHKEGCVMAFLPELSSCGYIPNENIWEHGEPLYGPTIKWLTGLSSELKMMIGAGFCECDGSDFYNSYVIANEEGQIDGIVRKMAPESYCFRPGNTLPIIETKWGTIGVGICADSHHIWFLKRLEKHAPDLIIIPHAWAIPKGLEKRVSPKDLDQIEKDITNLPRIYANYFGVPTIFVNQVGEFPTMQGIMGKFMRSDTFRLGGHSQIALPGLEENVLDTKEGLLVRDIDLTEKKPSVSMYPSHQGWLHPGNLFIRLIILPLEIDRGERYYRKSKKRHQIASIFKKIMDASQ